MKTAKAFIVTIIFFTTSSFAVEAGVCVLLGKNYADQLPVYKEAARLYEINQNSTPAYGQVGWKSPAEYKKDMDVAKAKLDKITTALRTHCYDSEDQETVKTLLK